MGALRERNDTEKVWEALSDPNKIVVTQVAPAVRTAWGEEFGLQPNEATVGMILDALKKMGADYVFDTCFSADLTIMEEATEFIQRFTSGELKERPMFTSCCPVPSYGQISFFSKVTAADVWYSYEDVFCAKTGRKSGADFHSLDHAVSGKKRRAGDGVVPRRICR